MSITTEIERIRTAKADIKSAIEEKGVTVGDGTIDTYPDKVRAISAGGDTETAYNEGVEAGKKSQHEEFWENYLGSKTVYSYAFCYWEDLVFYPTLDIILSFDAQRVFMSFNYVSRKPFNLKERLEQCGVTLDTSGVSSASYMFASSYISEIPELNFTKTTKLDGVFNLCSCLETIEKIILKDDGTQTFVTSTFNTTTLKNIIVEGKMGTDITFQSCPLTVASMKSVITHLVNHSGTDKAYTYTVKFSDACWAALEADSTSPTGTTWADYVNSLGWNT